ncbi:MAG: hypothetical protein QOJ85_3742 [Solirubrobacteraceae bacterium]|nr:hypothetical protein [Solirubrobacteraceae bacterium]
MQSTLGSFQETQSQDAFALQNSKLLKVSLNQITIQARLGSMVAYQGDVHFEHAGSGGLNKFIKKAVTGEGLKLMKVEGTGEVFLAHLAEDIHLIKLENDQITCNGQNVLAFDAGIEWDIKRLEGPGAAAGALAGGLYNMALSGSGWVAIVSDGPPVLLQTGDTPTFCDPQAAITWSSILQAHLKADVNMKSLIGKGSGESLQIGFVGAGWVLVQPSEGRVASAGSGGGGGGGGLLGSLGG